MAVKQFETKDMYDRDVTVQYDEDSGITVVHNYAPGRCLIFNGKEMDALHHGELPDEKLDENMAILIDAAELEGKNPAELYAKMKQGEEG